MEPPNIMFDNLQTALTDKPTTELYTYFRRDYHTSDGISNHFTEEPRMRCVVNAGERISPNQFWHKNKFKIITTAYQNAVAKDSNVNTVVELDLLSALNTTPAYKECNTFNPRIVINAVKKYFDDSTNVRMLDPSMGWGDRLIGGLACNLKSYTGFDPNLDLHSHYKDIDSAFNTNTKTLFIPERFSYQTLIDKNEQAEYDLALTSPPYFDYEIYTHTENDIKKSYDKWLKDMYIPYLNDMVKCVRVGGYIVIHISDIWNATLAGDTDKIMKRNNVKFIEKINVWNAYLDKDNITHKGGRSRPVWVYQK
jgi:hypothetical protein